MEREFLFGVDFNLYVDKSTYESWLNLLKGLIMAKERDSRHFKKSRSLAHQSRLAAAPHYPSSTGPATRTYVSSARQKPPVYRHRARSTSPTSRTASCPQPPPPTSAMTYTSTQYISPQTVSPTPRSGSKRTAQDAFSPTSASMSELPNTVVPETLVTAYMLDEGKRTSAPQVGFFFNQLGGNSLFIPDDLTGIVLLQTDQFTFIQHVCRWRISSSKSCFEVPPTYSNLKFFIFIWRYERTTKWTIVQLWG